MTKFKYLLFTLVAVLISGCGQRVVETLNVPQGPNMNGPGAGSTIVILPFADYTYSDDIASAYRRSMKVSESLTDSMSAQGFAMPVSEDVFAFLAKEKVISVDNYEKNTNTSLANEIQNGEWSDVMREKIRNVLSEEQVAHKSKVGDAPGTHALDAQELAKIGREFKADYIVRGRILEFTTRQDPTWEPWRKGLFPVISGGSAQILYGFAGSNEYDTVSQEMSMGLLGLGIGSASDWPLDDGIDLSGGISGNEIVWAAGGSMLGKQAAERGKVTQAVVQMRMWVQDATSGQVVWTNRAMVRVSPESIFADGQWDDLFNTAIDKSVSTLVQNFVATGL